MVIFGLILWWAINVYVWILLARVIISFVPLIVSGWSPRGILLVLVEAIYTLTDPPLRAISKVVRPIRLGNVALDLSILVLLVALQLLQRLISFILF